MNNKIWLFITIFVFFLACRSNQTKEEDLDVNEIIESMEDIGPEISEETLNAIIQSIPSPLETASVIKNSGVDFKSDILNAVENVNMYTTSYKKAFNIGVYGGDLGYINMYGKSYLALSYLNSIKKLADDLNVGQFFDFALIKRLASNRDKMDSLIYVSTKNFNKMDNYLREQKRGNLSVLIVAGTWLEGLYIATQVVKEKHNTEIFERIGEQKMIIDQIILILSAYRNDIYFNDLAEKFGEIKKEFDPITIEYIYREPETKEVDGILFIVDNSTTEVKITEEHIRKIEEVTARIRAEIILQADQ